MMTVHIFECWWGTQNVWLEAEMTSLLRVLTLPPPGWCLMFSVEPIFDLTFFRSGMGATGAMGVRRDPGDFGGVRTTATFFTWCPGVLERLDGDLGVAGLL